MTNKIMVDRAIIEQAAEFIRMDAIIKGEWRPLARETYDSLRATLDALKQEPVLGLISDKDCAASKAADAAENKEDHRTYTSLNKPRSDLQVENDRLRKIIYELADQQAIPDDWWEQELDAIDQARK